MVISHQVCLTHFRTHLLLPCSKVLIFTLFVYIQKTEYGYTLRVNEKSDIYSFGVVILELVTGRLPVDPEFGEKDLVKWVFATLDQKGLDQLIDPKLDIIVHKEEISRVLNIALLCTNALPINRPSMRRVVTMLQEASSDNKSKSGRKDGKLSPYYYYEDASDQGSSV